MITNDKARDDSPSLPSIPSEDRAVENENDTTVVRRLVRKTDMLMIPGLGETTNSIPPSCEIVTAMHLTDAVFPLFPNTNNVKPWDTSRTPWIAQTWATRRRTASKRTCT